MAKFETATFVGGYDRNPFLDKAKWETIKRSGNAAIKRWIDEQLRGTSVTVVLVGKKTGAVDGSSTRSTDETGVNPLPEGYAYYRWNRDG